MSAQKKKPNFFEKIGLALGLLKREVSILVLGLDNSGKSTLLTHLNSKKGDIKEVAPTVGFSVEGFKMGGPCAGVSGAVPLVPVPVTPRVLLALSPKHASCTEAGVDLTSVGELLCWCLALRDDHACL